MYVCMYVYLCMYIYVFMHAFMYDVYVCMCKPIEI